MNGRRSRSVSDVDGSAKLAVHTWSLSEVDAARVDGLKQD